jgi:energy-coupling factor transport system permease protein
MAMESRCYHGGENRTRLRVLKITKNDWLAAAGVAALILLIIAESHVTLPLWNMVKGLFA